MELPTGALAFKVFKNANISNEKQQLIRATIVTLTCDIMKRQLKVIFDRSTISANSESIDIKSERVFYVNKGTSGRYQDSKDSSRNGTSQYLGHGYRTSRDQYPRDGYRHNRNMPHRSHCYRRKKKTNGGKKTNPLDKSESISRCATCQSIYHWANDQMSK